MKGLAFVAVGLTGLVASGCIQVIHKFSQGDADDTSVRELGRKTFEATGPTETNDRPVGDFHGIRAGGLFHIEFKPGKSALRITAQSSVLGHIKSEVSGGVLELNLEDRWNHLKEIDIVVSCPKLDLVELSGVAQMKVKDVNVDRLKMDVSGSSQLEGSATASQMELGVTGAAKLSLTSIRADKVSLTMDGSTTGDLKGTAQQLKLEESGACHAELMGLRTSECDVTASGASQAAVEVAKVLHADATGASSISYHGDTNLQISETTTGASSVSRYLPRNGG